MPPALQTPTRDSSFASTRWTVVRQAADSQTASQHASSALSELCQIYWRPVYVFLRRRGIQQHDAQDLTQGFFTDLIESRTYARAGENLALIQTIVGNNSSAISTLTQLLQTPYNSWLYIPAPITSAFLRLDPFWDPLRGDPAFQKLCEDKQK